MKPVPTTEERVWAVLAHLSVLVAGMGFPLPIIGWAEQRRKSNYASFHCLQALGYQSVGYTVWFLLTLLLALVFVFVLTIVVALGNQNDQEIGLMTGSTAIIIASLVLALLVAYFVLPIIAALACALGRDFRYPFMGTRLARYLEYKTENEGWLNEEHEDRWVAAMGHFSVIIALWGMLAPITAWVMEGKRSAWLKFQSVQALVLHALVLLISAVGLGLYLMGFVVFAALIGFGEGAPTNSSAGMAGLVILIGSMLIAVLTFLIVPLFHIMGQWAGYRVLKGDDYRYPVIGRLVEKRVFGVSQLSTL